MVRYDSLQTALQDHAQLAMKEWWENYLKHEARFRGLKMETIRKTLHSWHAQHMASVPIGEQKDLAIGLLSEPYTEDKLAGMLWLQEILLPVGGWSSADLPAIAETFESGAIADWNSCDWLCIKALASLIKREGRSAAEKIADWRHGSTMWQRRAAGVSFVPLAPHGDTRLIGLTELVLEVCSTTVQDPARFAQTGTGWVLRELSRSQPATVRAFIEQNLLLFSSEALRYALAAFPKPEQILLKEQYRQTKMVVR